MRVRRLTLMLTLAALGVPVCSALECWRAPAGGITIDGDLREWVGAEAVSIGGVNDNTTHVRVLWDDTNLYIAFTVTDVNLWGDTKPNPWETYLNDSVEVLLDALNDGGSAPQTDDHRFHVDFQDLAMGVPHSQTNGGEVGTGSGWAGWGPAAAVWAARLVVSANNDTTTDMGFTYEIALDWDSVGVGAAPSGAPGTRGGAPPTVGQTQGITFRATDDDDGGAAEGTAPVAGTDPDMPSTYLDVTYRGTTPSLTPINPSPASSTIYDPPAGGAFWPSLLQLPTGRVLCASDANPTGGSTGIYVRRSDDAGFIWQALATVATASNDLANPDLLRLANGDLLCAFRETPTGSFALRVYRSTDNGASWSPLSTVHTNTQGLYEPDLLQLPDGTVLCAYANEEYAPIWPQVVELRMSHDNGLTWGSPVTVARNTSSRDGVPSLVRAIDHTLLCFFEAQDTPNPLALRVVRSVDGGLTWGGRSLVYGPANSAKRALAPRATALSDGRLLCGFGTDEDDPNSGDLYSDAKWIESNDLGFSWGAPKTLFASTATDLWPTFLELADHNLVIAHYTDSGANARLLARRQEGVTIPVELSVFSAE